MMSELKNLYAARPILISGNLPAKGKTASDMQISSNYWFTPSTKNSKIQRSGHALPLQRLMERHGVERPSEF
jgi:hypothetical protein